MDDEGIGSLFEKFTPPLGIKNDRKFFHSSKNRKEDNKEKLLKMINGESGEKYDITAAERKMIERVLRLNETKAKDVMTPRTSCFVVDIDDNIADILDSIIEERYSRVPVYEKDIDNIVGILHLKDLFAQVRKGNLEMINLRGILRQPYLVHEYKSLDELLLEMQRDRQPIAVIIDEYGGFSGLCTMEDILERIVGDISDEDDDDEVDEGLVKISDTTYKLDGFTSIQYVNDELGLNLPCDVNETMGGLLLEGLGRLPKKDGDPTSITIDGIELKAIKIDDRRIVSLLLRKNA